MMARLDAAFFPREDQRSSFYLSNFRSPCTTVPMRGEDAVAALKSEIARRASQDDVLVAFGEWVSVVVARAADIALLLEADPRIWFAEVFVSNEAMTWLIGFRHEELYLAGDACPPRGRA